MRRNEDIRKLAKAKQVCLYQIADKLGINDGNFSRRLRKELSEEEKKTIFDIIESIASGEQSAQKSY